MTIGDVSRLQVRLEVDEIDALHAREASRCVLFGDDGTQLAEGTIFRLAPRMGRKGLSTESPTARADLRVREIFVVVNDPRGLIPGQRVWGHATLDSGTVGKGGS